MTDKDFRDRDSGVTTLSATGPAVADHPSRKRVVERASKAPYSEQDPKDFKCPACGAGTGEPCRN
jgi:hypothetical protein